MKRILLLAIIFSAITVGASAQVAQGRIQRNRMEQGYRDGDFNRNEIRDLSHDQMRVNRARRHARQDGRITPYERRRIHRMQRHERRETFRYRHNRMHRRF